MNKVHNENKTTHPDWEKQGGPVGREKHLFNAACGIVMKHPTIGHDDALVLLRDYRDRFIDQDPTDAPISDGYLALKVEKALAYRASQTRNGEPALHDRDDVLDLLHRAVPDVFDSAAPDLPHRQERCSQTTVRVWHRTRSSFDRTPSFQ